MRMGHRRLLLAVVLLGAALLPLQLLAAGTLPDHLTDQEFWSLIESFSEDGGYFPSDN